MGWAVLARDHHPPHTTLPLDAPVVIPEAPSFPNKFNNNFEKVKKEIKGFELENNNNT